MTELGEVLGTDGNRATCLLEKDALTNERQAAGSDASVAFSVGSIVKIRINDRFVFGSLVDFTTDPTNADVLIANVELMGESGAGVDDAALDFERGINSYPLPGDRVTFASEADFAQIFSPPDEPHVQVGRVFPSRAVPAPILFDRLLGRHFAIVGSSGSGKSTLTAMLLNKVIGHGGNAHVVIVDPHGEYANAFGSSAKVWTVDNLQLPYWMMNLEEHCEALLPAGLEGRTTDVNIMAKCLLEARSRNLEIDNRSKLTADTPISYRLEDLIDALEDEGGRLEKPAESSHYTRIRLNIEQAFKDPRYRFIFDRQYAEATLDDTVREILRIPNSGQPISILDLTGVPTEIVNVVVSSIARLVLDFSIWAPRTERPPVLFVCEEAHRYLPTQASASTRSVVKQLERISREGRKYGVCLGLITQRPSELSPTALSQCGTIISLRLNNQQDQDILKASIPEAASSFVDTLSALKNRECIISGEGVPVTMRVQIDAVDQEHRPSSDDPLYSERWSKPAGDTNFVAEAIRRWRGGA